MRAASRRAGGPQPVPHGRTPDRAGRAPSIEPQLGAEELVRRVREGDTWSFDVLFRRHAPELLGVTARLLGSRSQAEDVVQDVFVTLHAELARYDGRAPFKTWLYGIAMNHVRGHRRRLWRHRATRLAGFFGWSHDAPSPETVCASGEAAQVLQRILSQMSDKQREVFVLYELEGLDGPSIARIVGCSVNTVWSRARLARADFERLVRRHRLVAGTEEIA